MPADETPPPTTTTISPTSTDKPTPTTTAAAPMPIEALNEPEIVAVSPPPQGPKQSQPAPPRPVEPPTSAVSPVVRKLETLALAVPPQGGDPSEFYVELPDTSVPRPASAGADAAAGSSGVAGAAEMGGGEDAAEAAAKEAGPGATPARAEAAEAVPAAAGDAKPVLATLRAPVDDVSVLVAEDVVMTPGGARMDFDDFEEMLLGGEKTLGGHWREEYGRQRERKRKDPAVLVEIPSTPSAHAYEVAAHNKLDEQYFAPVYEDKGTADEVELPPPSRRVTTEDLAADAADKNKTGADVAAPEEKGSSVAAVAAGAAAVVKDAALKVVDTLTGGTGGTKA